MDDKTAAQAEMLANRLQKRFRHLRKWARRSDIEAFRLYDRDIPEIPLALDFYGQAAPGAAVISGALYQRPYEKDETEEGQWLMAMADAAAHSLDLDRDHIIIKRRERQRGDAAQYGKIADRGVVREVREGGLRFRVNLSDYLDTGLFLDRRAMRRMIGADSGGKRVLNLFCYTASFSVYAAQGGAASTDSVDLSNTYLAWARDNFALNGFDAEICNTESITNCNTKCNTKGNNKNSTTNRHEPARTEEEYRSTSSWSNNKHRLIRADVSAFLRTAAEERRRWDSIIVDPPAFSNSTMASADFDLRRDYANLLGDCLALLSPNGKLWFSASARSFKTGAAELEMALQERFPRVAVTDIGGALVDEDFKGRRMPKAFVVENN
jgi:23S rRNA G2069 N7-methylase RlmK/C1962 C5-methylase RlmI